MTLQRVFAIFDSKVEAFLPPITRPTAGAMEREFTNHCKNPESPFFKNPEDYTLFEIGTWDEKKGLVEMLRTPLSLGLALEFKVKS